MLYVALNCLAELEMTELIQFYDKTVRSEVRSGHWRSIRVCGLAVLVQPDDLRLQPFRCGGLHRGVVGQHRSTRGSPRHRSGQHRVDRVGIIRVWSSVADLAVSQRLLAWAAAPPGHLGGAFTGRNR